MIFCCVTAVSVWVFLLLLFFYVLFAVFLALFLQATKLVHLNHMHSDGGGWGVGDEEEEKRRETERERESLPIYCWKSERPVTTTTLPALSGKEAASRATRICD